MREPSGWVAIGISVLVFGWTIVMWLVSRGRVACAEKRAEEAHEMAKEAHVWTRVEREQSGRERERRRAELDETEAAAELQREFDAWAAVVRTFLHGDVIRGAASPPEYPLQPVEKAAAEWAVENGQLQWARLGNAVTMSKEEMVRDMSPELRKQILQSWEKREA